MSSATYREPPSAPGVQVVVVGASAGGVEALTELVSKLPADGPLAFLVVLHLPPHGRSMLADILGRHSAVAVRVARDGDRLEPGTIYVAPSDHHLLVESPDTLRVESSPLENGHRPAIDPTMRSAADVFGSAAAGVVLSGTLDDGTSGLRSIKERGGMAVVQDPAEARYSGMPRSALENVAVDAVLPVAQIAAWLVAAASADSRSRTTRAAATGDPGPELEPHLPDAHARSLEAALWTAARRLEYRADDERTGEATVASAS
jgi:two-component system, chemotaxis family, protein-glutamate methylesterase/glutaminase